MAARSQARLLLDRVEAVGSMCAGSREEEMGCAGGVEDV